MKFKSIIVCVIVFAFMLLSGCKTAVVPGAKVSEQEDYIRFESVKPTFTMQFFGDYWFHEYHKKYILNYNPALFKSLKKPLAGIKPKLLFITHTTIPPYISAMALVYDKKEGAQLLTEAAKEELKSDLGIKTLDFTETQYGIQKFYRGEYLLKNRLMRVQSNQIDHFINVQDKTIRLIFWSQDSYEPSFINETEKIVRTLEIKEE